MKKYIISIALLSIICIFTYYSRHTKTENDILCRCLFIYLSSYDDNYLLEVTKDSIVKVSSGRINFDFYPEILYEDRKLKGKLSDFKFFEKVTMQKEKKLKAEEFDTLKACVSDIKDINNLVNPFIQSNWKDSWAAVIIVGEKKYVFVFIPTPELKVFMDKIMSLSPVEMRDEYYQRELKFSYIYDHPYYIKSQPFKKTVWERIKEWFVKEK